MVKHTGSFYSLDPDPGPGPEPWNLDPEPGPGTWTQTLKIWTLKNLDLEKPLP